MTELIVCEKAYKALVNKIEGEEFDGYMPFSTSEATMTEEEKGFLADMLLHKCSPSFQIKEMQRRKDMLRHLASIVIEKLKPLAEGDTE